jgi:alkylation response protein AidB-like acyl-CoA dehydrogenase
VNSAVDAPPQVDDAVDLDELAEGLREFVRAEVIPRHKAFGPLTTPFGDNGRFREDVLQAYSEVRQVSARSGFYTMLAPAEVGGGGLGFEAMYRAWSTVFDVCGAEYWLGHQLLCHWSRGPSHLHLVMDAEFRNEILPDLISGVKTSCFAMSEPDAGSDVWQMRTTAKRVDGGWVLNGTKQWSTNSPYASWGITFAVTDAEAFRQKQKNGLTGFFIDMTAPGMRIESVIAMFGHSGGDEGIISFNDMFVPDRQVIGRPGDGLKHAMSGVSMGRVYNAARSVGLAKWALRKALEYAEMRHTFGHPLIENQAISFPLATSSMELHAAYTMGIDTARRLDRGEQLRREVSMIKAFSTEMAVRAIDHAVQVHGAMGFTNELHLSEAWQQMRRTCVADGSSEIMRTQIVKSLRADGVQF